MTALCEIHECSFSSNGKSIVIFNLSDILPVYLVDRLYRLDAVTGDKYCIFGQKIPALSRGETFLIPDH